MSAEAVVLIFLLGLLSLIPVYFLQQLMPFHVKQLLLNCTAVELQYKDSAIVAAKMNNMVRVRHGLRRHCTNVLFLFI